MRAHRILLSIAIPVAFGIAAQTAAFSEEYRGTLEQQMACTPDVFRLCGAQMPDANRIVACLRQNTPQLSGAVPRGVRIRVPAPPRERDPGRPRRDIDDLATANRPARRSYGRSSQTSTHSAATSSAIRAGAIRTALWIEPAAGTTSSNAFRDTSQ